MNRKSFLQCASLSAGALIASPSVITSQSTGTNMQKLDPLPPEKVKQFVAAGHNNLDKVKEMLLEFPTLLYATWDVGGGDFETAIEGAGHVGNKEIANYLIEKGARVNLFVMTMLGKTAFVKSYLDMYPSYITARGPHGLTFLHHAQRGGEDAKELLAYFQAKGLKETKSPL
jgi:hypothetical protein